MSVVLFEEFVLPEIDRCEVLRYMGCKESDDEIDALIDRAVEISKGAFCGKVSPSMAVCLQALGAERIEALCDQFCADMARKQGSTGKSLRPRFSPGYGDFPLEAQKDIFTVLGCDRRIGLTLNNSLIMSPTKSVTAIIGIY